MRVLRVLVMVVAVGVALGGLAAVADEPAERMFVTRAEIEVDGKASSAGRLSVLFEPNGGDPVELSVEIEPGMNDERIAGPLTAKFAATLAATHEVTLRGSSVRFRPKEGSSPAFRLTVTELSALDVGVRLSR